jgi:branched-chain amino acid transport system substrate-binding protein
MRITRAPLATTAIMLLALAGCGSDPASDPGTTEGDATEEGAPDAEGSALVGTGTGESCEIEAPVPAGAVLSLTGAAGSYGESQRRGLDLAVEQLNEQGGVTYDLTIEDDATDPAQGITVFEQFVSQDDMSVIIGPTLSNTARQTDPVAQEGQTPVLGISNTAAGITDIGDYIFRDSLTEDAVIPQTIAAAKESIGLERVVVMYSNDDAFTDSGYQAFQAALEANDIEIVETLTFSKTDTDFRALLTQAREAEPDALVVSALVEAAIPLVTQARELGITVPIIGGNGFNTPQLMADAGEAAEGVIVGAAWNSASESELNTAFLEAYQAEYDAAPDQFSAQAYAGMKLIDTAVRAGCSGEREHIQEQLGQFEGVPTVLGEFTMTDTRDAEHPAVVQIVEDGEFAVLE